MKKRHFIFLKVLCWLVLGAFVLATAGVHKVFADASRPHAGLLCGNAVMDPAADLMNYGMPIGVVVIVALGFLWRRGVAAGWSVILAALVVVGCTASLVALGMRFFGGMGPRLHLSDIIWWLKPVGGLFGN